MQKTFPSVLPKRVYQIPLWLYSKSSQKNLQSMKKHQMKMFQNEVWLISSRNHFETTKGLSGIKKSLKFKKINTPPVTNSLSWCVAVWSRGYFPVLIYIDILAKDFNCVKYLLVRQDLLDRTVDTKGMKTEGSYEIVRTFLTMIPKKNRPEIFGSTRELNLLESSKKLWNAEGTQNCPIGKETKAALAERKIPPLKTNLHCYKKDYA